MQFERIRSISSVGKRKSYDLSIKGRWKGYLANGIQTHNSGGDFRSSFSAQDAMDVFEDAKEFRRKYPEAAEACVKLEGQVRGSGQHAAGIVVSKDSLYDGLNAALVTRSKEEVLVNWDKEDAEYMGLMKLDVLGLNALTILHETSKLVEKSSGIPIDFISLPLDDGAVFAEFSNGNNIGCFQFSSLGLRKLCQEMGIENFDLLVAANALHRPGTLRSGATTEFILRKKGEKQVVYKHPFIEEITKSTFGIILYQEQVMRFMYELGGLGWRTADTVRKVISKSKGVEQFLKFREMFVEGCKERKTLDEKTAGEMWDELASFGSYSFNLSHSVEYSLISMWDMWCVAGRTMIWDCDRNAYITVAKAYREGIVNTISMFPDGSTRPNRVLRIIKTGDKFKGKKPVYAVRLKSAKRLYCTMEHKILTPDGYKKLSDLRVGDFVAAEKRVTPHNSSWSLKVRASLKSFWRSKGTKYRKDRTKPCRNVSGILAGDHEHRSNMAKDRWKNASEEKRARMFNNWILTASRSKNGYYSNRFVGRASDGHRVFSKGELLVDEWLTSHGLKHDKEILIGRKFADFLVGGVYIEYDGVGREDIYFEEKFGDEPLLVLKPGDDLDDNLSFLLEAKEAVCGRQIIYEQIVSIDYWKDCPVYDLVMDEPAHNFLANGVVVHNCKIHHPLEFMAASLSWGSDNKKSDLVEEAFRMGIDVCRPTAGISKSKEWAVHDGKLYVPYIEIRGLGDKTVEAVEGYIDGIMAERGGSGNGFFEKKASARMKGKVANILADVGVMEPIDAEVSSEELRRISEKYFDFSLDKDPMRKFRYMLDKLGNGLKFSKLVELSGYEVFKDLRYYFGRMTEIKFGYRGKLDTLAKRLGASGTSDALGGVYGNIADDTGFSMIVFSPDLYASKKSEIEHCSGKWMIIKADRPTRATNIFCKEVWMEEDLLSGNIAGLGLCLAERRFVRDAGDQFSLVACDMCDLRSEARQVVLPSFGKYNVAICGEAPGSEENRKGVGFVGKTGAMLWEKLAKRGHKRELFHVTNVVKCFVDPNVEIYTSKGPKKICDILVGDIVLSHKGKFSKVIWVRPHEKMLRGEKLVKIKYRISFNSKCTKSVVVTPEHPFLVGGKWVAARNIKPGDGLRVLAKGCLNCGNNIPSCSRIDFCDRSCSAAYSNKNRSWSQESLDKKSKSMKELYRSGVLDRSSIARRANDKTREEVSKGTFHLQKGNRTFTHPWKGLDKYSDERIKEATEKSYRTNKKPGLFSRLPEIGRRALDGYYSNHDRIIRPKNKGTKIESIMAWALRKCGFSDFKQNKYIQGYYPDILFEDDRVIVECDGVFWHSRENSKKGDQRRDSILSGLGFTVLHFTDEEIKKDVFACVGEVSRVLRNHRREYSFVDVEVVSVKEVTNYVTKRLYNFGVEGDESYIANSVVSHNCFPASTKTPAKKHIHMCGKWLREELLRLDPLIILAFGNTCVKFFKDLDSGISSLNATVEWNEEYKCWICWSMHPASVLYHRENEPMLDDALDVFCDRLRNLAGL